MTGTWAARWTDADGHRQQYAPGPEDIIRECAADVARIDGITPEIVDLAAEAADRYPAGSRVRHTASGREGTVTPAAPFLHDPGDHRPHIQIDHNGAVYVAVQFDGRGWPCWWAADPWIAPLTVRSAA